MSVVSIVTPESSPPITPPIQSGVSWLSQIIFSIPVSLSLIHI